MSRRRAPRPAAEALRSVRQAAAPKTGLAAVQNVWGEAVGKRLARAARPTAEHDGAIVVSCSDPVWAQELDLMQDELLSRLREHLGDAAPRGLRFRVQGAQKA